LLAADPIASTTPSGGKTTYDEQQIVQWIADLRDPNKRENALLELRFGVCVLFILI
jgi:hypothetical protein